jgi:hypothetical protein
MVLASLAPPSSLQHNTLWREKRCGIRPRTLAFPRAQIIWTLGFPCFQRFQSPLPPTEYNVHGAGLAHTTLGECGFVGMGMDMLAGLVRVFTRWGCKRRVMVCVHVVCWISGMIAHRQ